MWYIICSTFVSVCNYVCKIEEEEDGFPFCICSLYVYVCKNCKRRGQPRVYGYMGSRVVMCCQNFIGGSGSFCYQRLFAVGFLRSLLLSSSGKIIT